MPTTLESRLPEVAVALRPRVSAAAKAAAEVIAERARQRVPVGAPDVHIRDHINVVRSGPAQYAVVAGDEETFYGHFLEFGTVHSAAQPFLVPAVEDSAEEAVALVEAALRAL